MSNSTSTQAKLSSLNLGGGLIEIAALTALIGSTTAESLVLGNKRAAGLVWGTQSIFGALSVIRGCIAAATADHIRESVGLRTKETDLAVGLSLNLDVKSLKNRSRIGGAAGVICKVGVVPDTNEKMGTRSLQTSRHDAYALDQYTTSKLELLPESNSFLAHLLAPDPYATQRARENAWLDWIGILASFAKLAEIIVLYLHHAPILGIISGCCWLYFLIAATFLQFFGISREFPEGSDRPELDVIAGQLPTPIKDGGAHKILLGAPQNVRNSLSWRIVWGLGSIVTTTTVIASYMTLSSLSSRVFAIWVGFQFLWLGLRSVFYHFAEGTESNFHHPILLGKTWVNLSAPLKVRVRGLVLALSKYQMHVHPRGIYCYGEDRESLAAIGQLRFGFPLTTQQRSSRSLEITVVSVIGDTLLSSAGWVFGLKTPAMDMYDTCIIIVDVNGVSIAIPASRVLTDAPPPRSPDVETGEGPQYPPKGGSNRGRHIAWWYWIPCEDGNWLQVHSTDMQFLGKRFAEVLTNDEVTFKLKSGSLFVGISEVAHVKETVRNSTRGLEVLEQLLEE